MSDHPNAAGISLTLPRPAAADEAHGVAEPAAVPGYQILSELGRGGMGVVYKARQIALNRVVALKMILAGAHAGGEERARFLAEAEAVAAICHPGIVQVYEFGTHDGTPYFALEYCQGGTLAKALGGTPLQAREAAQVVERVARAVHAAHQAGIIHRDLKPANVLLSGGGCEPPEPSPPQGVHTPRPPGEPKVADFGLARRDEGSGLTATGAVMGTPSYASPEQARGEKNVGPATDVYGLGAILYECLTGRPPFKAATTYETILQVINDEPVSVRQLNARTPRDLETICQRCLNKEPQRRYRSAQELADDLRRFLEGRPIVARPVGTMERAAKWVRRNPTVAALLALVALSLTLGMAATTVFALRESDQAEKAREQAKRADDERDKAIVAKKEADDQRGKTAAALLDVERQLDRAEATLYASQLASAQREWESGNVRLAWSHLDSTRWDLRGWEHSLLYARFTQNHVVCRGHGFGATDVAFSPDGRRFVTADGDGLKVWDARTAQVLFALEGHTDFVTAVAYSPDASRIVSGSEDCTLMIWDAHTGKPLRTLRGHEKRVTAVGFSPDGTRVVSGSEDGTLKVWDATTGKGLLSPEGHARGVSSLAYCPDGSSLASGGSDGTLKVWDATTGRLVRTHRYQQWVTVKAVAFSPDGSRLVSANDRTLDVWDTRSGVKLHTLTGHTGDVDAVSCSPDGRHVLSGGRDGTLRVWDFEKGTLLRTLKGHLGGVTGVSYSPDGTRIVSCGDDVRLWDAWAEQGPLVFERLSKADLALAFASVTALAYSPDGSRMVVGDDNDEVSVRDAHTGEGLLSLRGHKSVVTGVAYSPDGTRIVSGSWDQTVKTWDAKTGKHLFTFEGHKGHVRSVAYSPDGARIASGGDDRTVKVWDVRTGQNLLTLEGHANSVTSVAYSPDGSRIASAGHKVTIWDANTGQRLLTLTEHLAGVSAVAYSPDGSRLVSASSDKTLKVWDANTGRNLLTLEGHLYGVRLVAYSPDGTRIASGSHDGMLKIWDAKTGVQLLALATVPLPVGAIAFSPDGLRLASAGMIGTVRTWQADAAPDTIHLLSHGGADIPADEATFSSDGSRVMARFHFLKPLFVWSARTGRQLPAFDETFPDGPARLVSDGRVLQIENGMVALVDPRLRERRLLREREWLANLARFDAAKQRREAEAAQANVSPAAVWHLDRLMAYLPHERPELLKRRALLLWGATDPSAVSAQARGLLAWPDGTHERRRLLPLLAGKAAAADLRALANLQLLAGAPDAARDTLRLAIERRRADAPPIEELLLALVCHQTNQREAALAHLATARMWRAELTRPLSAATLLSLRLSGPLPSLAVAVSPVDDPRLETFDAFTRVEFDALFERATRTLAAKPERR